MKTTNILSISKKDLDCNKVVSLMQRLNIIGSVTPNITVGPNDTENGCRIIFDNVENKEEIKTYWSALKFEFRLGCAHLKTSITVSPISYLHPFR